MRLWSLAPEYLDAAGLVALWREALLARAVLEGKTRGYIKHPQLERFRRTARPAFAADKYLRGVYAEAMRRGYRFDASKLYCANTFRGHVQVTVGQLEYELEHLRRKLEKRCPAKLAEWAGLTEPRTHPLFKIIPGAVEKWERVGGRTAARVKRKQPDRQKRGGK